jgi:hypothetical protein
MINQSYGQVEEILVNLFSELTRCDYSYGILDAYGIDNTFRILNFAKNNKKEFAEHFSLYPNDKKNCSKLF